MAYSQSPSITKDDVAGIIPQPAIDMPPAADLEGSPGSSKRFALEDHTHEVKVQRVAMITNATGLATWTFAKPIICETGLVPVCGYMVEDQTTPVVVQIIGRTFSTINGKDVHTAVTVRAQRSQTLPAILLSLTNLLNFNVFGGSPASIRVNLIASAPTQ